MINTDKPKLRETIVAEILRQSEANEYDAPYVDAQVFLPKILIDGQLDVDALVDQIVRQHGKTAVDE